MEDDDILNLKVDEIGEPTRRTRQYTRTEEKPDVMADRFEVKSGGVTLDICNDFDEALKVYDRAVVNRQRLIAMGNKQPIQATIGVELYGCHAHYRVLLLPKPVIRKEDNESGSTS